MKIRFITEILVDTKNAAMIIVARSAKIHLASEIIGYA